MRRARVYITTKHIIVIMRCLRVSKKSNDGLKLFGKSFHEFGRKKIEISVENKIHCVVSD